MTISFCEEIERRGFFNNNFIIKSKFQTVTARKRIAFLFLYNYTLIAMVNNKMDLFEYDFFNLLNDAVLLSFDKCTPWEKVFISDVQHRAINKQLISKKQKMLAMKILSKCN